MTHSSNRSIVLFSLAFTAASAIYSLWKENRNKTEQSRFRQAFGQPQTLPDGTQVARCRMSYEEFESLIYPEKAALKPPLPENLDVENLPKYWGGCPHCGKMSLVGENMWRYHELSRTRGYMNNTTTFVCRCRNCHGFMQSTVDHDD